MLNKLLILSIITLAPGLSMALDRQNENDKISYSLGSVTGTQVKQLNANGSKINLNALIEGIQDALKDQLQLDPMEINKYLHEVMHKKPIAPSKPVAPENVRQSIQEQINQLNAKGSQATAAINENPNALPAPTPTPPGENNLNAPKSNEIGKTSGISKKFNKKLALNLKKNLSKEPTKTKKSKVNSLITKNDNATLPNTSSKGSKLPPNVPEEPSMPMNEADRNKKNPDPIDPATVSTTTPSTQELEDPNNMQPSKPKATDPMKPSDAVLDPNVTSVPSNPSTTVVPPNPTIKELSKLIEKSQTMKPKNHREDLLTFNRNTTKFKKLKSGLQYKVLSAGDLKAKSPAITDKVKVHYRGILLNGEEFDSSYNNQPIVFNLSNVIKGWQEALMLMKPHAKWKIFVPPHLAYGNQKVGPIPENSTLIFDVELLEINPKS